MSRRATDPQNRWLWAAPLTTEELAQARAEAQEQAAAMHVAAPERYTCDECSQAPLCTLAFDGYNTDGDCLYEK